MKKKIIITVITGVLIISGIVINIINKKPVIIDDDNGLSFTEELDIIIVQISGAVKRPGVYEMCNNDRVNDLVIKAGGLLNNADLENLNLVEKLNDGMKVVINFKNNNNSSNDKISINKANMEELMTLTGIGQSKAKNIIDYRNEHGGFKNINELLKVNGISENTLSKIIDNICL